MRQALPVLYCVPDDIRAKLLGMITELDSVPDVKWVEWLSSDAQQGLDYFKGVDTDRFIRQAPSKSRG